MNRPLDFNLAWLTLFVVACFACPTVAQQPSSGVGANSASMTGAFSTTDLYSVGGNDMDREAAARLTHPMTPKTSNRTGAATSRSAWMAGNNSMGSANKSMWIPGNSSFHGQDSKSWIAGAGSFGLDRQRGGIWTALPGPQAQPNEPIESDDLAMPSGLTSKGAAVLKRARLSSSILSSRGQRNGVPGLSSGRVHSSSYGAHARGFGNPGGATGNSTRYAPSSTVSGSSSHGVSDLDHNFRSLDSSGHQAVGADDGLLH